MGSHTERNIAGKQAKLHEILKEVPFGELKPVLDAYLDDRRTRELAGMIEGFKISPRRIQHNSVLIGVPITVTYSDRVKTLQDLELADDLLGEHFAHMQGIDDIGDGGAKIINGKHVDELEIIVNKLEVDPTEAVQGRLEEIIKKGQEKGGRSDL